MKYPKPILQTKVINMIIIISIISFSSCKKDQIKTIPLGSLNIINMVTGGPTVRNGSNATTVANNAAAYFGLLIGNPDIYVWPVGDSTHPYYNASKSVRINRGDVYSLFFGGTPAAVDVILVKEMIPYRTDSTAGIRFINLSPNSTPLNITLSTTPTVNQVTGLAYKQITGFISYPGLYNSAYTFQIKNGAGTVLTTFALTAATVPRFANITLVIRGIVGATPAIGVTRVNNDR